MNTSLTQYSRYFAYAVLVFILFLLMQAWHIDHPEPIASSSPTSSAVNPLTTAQPVSNTKTTIPTQATPLAAPINQIVHVKTDVMQIDIDTKGGNIVNVNLLKFPESLHSNKPFLLLNNNPDSKYIAESGLISTTGPDTTKGQAVYKPDQNNVELAANQNESSLKLTWQDKGLTVTKIFTFKRNDYNIGVNYVVANQSTQPWQGNLYLQILRTNNPPPSPSGMINLATYFGAAISSPEKPFEKIPFKTMSQENLNRPIQGGWAAMIQHYFISAWIPEKNTTSTYFSRVNDNGLYTIGLIGPNVVVNPGEQKELSAHFYAGPSSAEQLEKVAPGLKLTIDYGWFWFISGIIFWMMQKIYNVVGNWGWSIVLVTLVIKLLFYHLSAKSYRSMSAMKTLQPKINALKERFGDDKQKFTQATLELYKKEKVNPMSGCLPILVQIPVFIALYWVLIESVQLRQAPFILWIHDLSVKDPYFILPVLMGLSMFLQQRLNPPPADPVQAKVMLFMPIVFTALFFNFPAGLMLYWFVNNTLSFLQQWYIMRTMEADAKKVKNKK